MSKLGTFIILSTKRPEIRLRNVLSTKRPDTRALLHGLFACYAGPVLGNPAQLAPASVQLSVTLRGQARSPGGPPASTGDANRMSGATKGRDRGVPGGGGGGEGGLGPPLHPNIHWQA